MDPHTGKPPSVSSLDLPVLPAPDKDRYCLVSVGATTTFRPLVEKVLDPAFLSALLRARYTRLTIQCGPDAEHFQKATAQFAHPVLRIDVLDYVNDLTQLMRLCHAAGGPSPRDDGVLISHAGTGTVLDAMLTNIPIVIVPNPTLQDNHQVELAEELEKASYAVHGSLDNLPAVIPAADALRSSAQKRFPSHTVNVDPAQQDDPANFWDYVDAVLPEPPRGRDVAASGSAGHPVPSLDESERDTYGRLVEG